MGETVEAVVPDEFDAWSRANLRVTNLERAEVYDVLLQALVRMMVSGGTHDEDYVRMLVERALDPRWRGRCGTLATPHGEAGDEIQVDRRGAQEDRRGACHRLEE